MLHIFTLPRNVIHSFGRRQNVAAPKNNADSNDYDAVCVIIAMQFAMINLQDVQLDLTFLRTRQSQFIQFYLSLFAAIAVLSKFVN